MKAGTYFRNSVTFGLKQLLVRASSVCNTVPQESRFCRNLSPPKQYNFVGLNLIKQRMRFTAMNKAGRKKVHKMHTILSRASRKSRIHQVLEERSDSAGGESVADNERSSGDEKTAVIPCRFRVNQRVEARRSMSSKNRHEVATILNIRTARGGSRAEYYMRFTVEPTECENWLPDDDEYVRVLRSKINCTRTLQAVCEWYKVNVLLADEQRLHIQHWLLPLQNPDLWKRLRLHAICASVAKRAYKLHSSGDPSGELCRLWLNPEPFTSPEIVFGQNNEKFAIRDFLESLRKEGENVEEAGSGMYVHPSHQWLRATPDNTVWIGSPGNRNEFLVEVKSLFSCQQLRVSEWIESRDSRFCLHKKESSGELELKHNHAYMFQVVQQMYVSGIHQCYFVCHVPRVAGTHETVADHMFIQKINYADYSEWWESEVLPVLEYVFFNAIAWANVSPSTLRQGKLCTWDEFQDPLYNGPRVKFADVVAVVGANS